MMLSGSVGRKGRNLRTDVVVVQRLINAALKLPFVPLKVDGLVGSKTIYGIESFQRYAVHFRQPDGLIEVNGKTWQSLKRFLSEAPVTSSPLLSEATPSSTAVGKIAWGAKVADAFKQKVLEVSLFLDVSPDYLMACMAFETGEKFESSVKNAAGSGAVGLIQFMPATARAIGTSSESLSKMSAISQLEYVKKYLSPYKGRLKSLEDVYMAILYPAAVGKSSNHVLFEEGRIAYKQNKGFDANSDGKITLKEISSKVREKYEKGLQPGYFG